MAKRILYVEDHLNNMLLVKRIVQAEGHEFLTSTDGEGGWLIAVDRRPDLIFVDLRLPGAVDGYELIRKLKCEPGLKAVPVVVLTAYGNGSAEGKAEEAGCDDFLQKPADIRQIREVIRRYVGQPVSPVYLPARQPARFHILQGT